jgi:hypothetical protein
MELSAVGAAGKRPVGHGEGVLDLSTGLSVAGEEAGSKGVGLGGEGIDGDGPADSPGQAEDLVPEIRGAHGARDVKGSVPGEVVDAFLYEGATRGVQEQRAAADATLEATCAHGALL